MSGDLIAKVVRAEGAIPYSPEVQEVADKLGDAIALALNAAAAPDFTEVFDLVLTSAAAFFCACKDMRHKRDLRYVCQRFEEALLHQNAILNPESRGVAQ